MVSFRCLSSKDVAKNVCDGDQMLAWHGERVGVMAGFDAQLTSMSAWTDVSCRSSGPALSHTSWSTFAGQWSCLDFRMEAFVRRARGVPFPAPDTVSDTLVWRRLTCVASR
jgi:hypothetical protein